MQTKFLVRQLRDNGRRIEALASGLEDEEYRWKDTPGTWSILEVIHHLLDEEKFDFKVRLNIILHQPTLEWPPIRPEVWVDERQYNQQDPLNIINRLLFERKTSLQWLSSLGEINWKARYSSSFGAITAGDMLTSWVSHDCLHMRQLVEIHYSLIASRAQPYQGSYAGDW
jgi:hypothetical protein